MTRRRLLVASIALLAAAQCLVLVWFSLIGWSTRHLMTSDPLEIARRTHSALLVSLWAGVHVVGVIAYLFRGRSFGPWVLAGIQAASLPITLSMGFRNVSETCSSNGFEWFWLSGLEAITLVLVYVLCRRAKQSALSNGRRFVSLAVIVVLIGAGMSLLAFGWHLGIEGLESHSGVVRTVQREPVDPHLFGDLHVVLDTSSHDYDFSDFNFEPLPDIRAGDQVVILTAQSCAYGTPIAAQSTRGLWVDDIDDDGMRPFTPQTWPGHEAIRWLALVLGAVVGMFGLWRLFRWIG